MNLYDSVRLYFHRVDRAVKCSIDGKQANTGIKSAATQLRCGINKPGSIKIICTFRFKNENIFLHDAYSWQIGMTFSWQDKLVLEESDYKTLVPTDVSITIDKESYNYSVADLILLEGFLCPPNQTS